MCMDGGSSRSKSSQKKILGGGGGGASYSTFQSLQNYPELISKYKVISLRRESYLMVNISGYLKR